MARCCLSIPPENMRNSEGFLMFSGGIDKQHQALMDQGCMFIKFSIQCVNANTVQRQNTTNIPNIDRGRIQRPDD